MKVLISIFQVFLMIMVGLFLIGALEIVSYSTVNKPLAYRYLNDQLEEYEEEFISTGLFKAQHWTIQLTNSPYWLNH